MKKYTVHAYVTVRVRACNIAAENQAEALEKADKILFEDTDLSRMFPDRTSVAVAGSEPVVESGGYAEEVTSYLVDEEGDPDYDQSRWYGPDKKPLDKGE